MRASLRELFVWDRAHATDLSGRALTINEAKPKSERSRSGGHRFGGEGGRGRDDYRGHPRQPRERRW